MSANKILLGCKSTFKRLQIGVDYKYYGILALIWAKVASKLSLIYSLWSRSEGQLVSCTVLDLKLYIYVFFYFSGLNRPVYNN